MQIRRVDIRKLEAQSRLLALQQLCLPYDKPFDSTHGHWWIAVSAAGLDAGFAGLVPSVRWSDCGYLCRAGVAPLYRGQGIQKQLIRLRIRQAKTEGYAWLVTDTHENPASSNSLIATGFKLFEPSKPWGAKGTLYWKLSLKD